VGGLVVLAILCCIPIYVRTIITVLNRLNVDASGAAFTGRYRRWQVNMLTGRVAGTNTYSTTQTNVSYGTIQTDYGSKNVVTDVRTSTSVHNTLLLVDRTGQQHSITLTNFGLEVFNDQIVSICGAVRGSKQVVIAVLNHSTKRQFTRKRNFYKIVHPHGVLLGFWLVFWILLALVASLALSFVGYFVFWLIVIISAAISWAATNRQLRGFTSSGINPLWKSGAEAAAALL
jgi:hypothetical protein